MAAGLRCGSTTIKYLLFFFNFLFVLCGLVILVVGGLAANQMRLAGNGLGSAVIFIIVVGAFIFVVSFFGCCGAVRESHCMLITFACLLLTIIVCEVVAAIMLFVAINGSNIDKFIEDTFNKAKNHDEAAMASVDIFQQGLQCCGLKDPNFWIRGELPKSCCRNNDCTNPNNKFSKGCQSLIRDVFSQFGLALGVIAISVAVIEVLGVWFALALAGEIKNLSR